MDPQDLGKWGEDVAVRHLKEQGILVLCRNFRVHRGEADIIGVDGDTLVAFEIKTRRCQAFGGGLAALTRQKLERGAIALMTYSQKNVHTPKNLRIDALIITVKEIFTPEIDWIKNIYESSF